MLRLHLLGSRELERTDHGDASAVFAQPKRFALLAYMACRADRFHRRDTLLAVFWPELDTFAARRALRNALYQLRLALGDDVFIARGDDELMVDPRALYARGRDSTGHRVDAVLLARRNGANIIVDGSYYRAGDSLLFTANLLMHAARCCAAFVMMPRGPSRGFVVSGA